jgi:hypothetical protein
MQQTPAPGTDMVKRQFVAQDINQLWVAVVDVNYPGRWKRGMNLSGY